MYETFVVVGLGVYVLATAFVGAQLRRHAVDGRAPVGFAAYRKSTYTPAGQRWLKAFWILVLGTPVAFVIISGLARLLFR